MKIKVKITGENIKVAIRMNQSNSVAIHIRRAQIDLVLQPAYYYESINQISNPHFFIFSDDIE